MRKKQKKTIYDKDLFSIVLFFCQSVGLEGLQKYL